MLKRAFFITLFAGIYAIACAQSFCHLVQDVGTSYSDTIKEGGTYYYSAWTYDLPMDVWFMTEASCTEVPQIWSDLTCNPGHYDDPKIQELIRDTVKYGISVPMQLKSETQWVDSLGVYVHHIKLGKKYRNRLKLVGVDYNVPAYVKVVLPCGGIAKMEQDTSSQACLNDARRLELPDETRVLAKDSLSTYIFPYKDWLTIADSVALTWNGPTGARIWVAGDECEFETRTDDGHVWNYYDVEPGGELHLSRNDMQRAVEEGTQDTTGILFAKIVSSEEGTLSSRPLYAQTFGATLLRLNTRQAIEATNAEAVYCFPKDWESVEWIANTRKVVHLYIYATPEAEPVDSFLFDLQDSLRRVLRWTKQDMNLVREKATGALLFARFSCSKDFKLLPQEWTNNACEGNTIRLRSGSPMNMAKAKSSEYRLYYPDFQGYPMEIVWQSDPADNARQTIYMADQCDFMALYSQRNFMTLYQMTKYVADTIPVTRETIDTWNNKGYIGGASASGGWLYIKFTKELATATITFTSFKPAEQDPEGDDPDYPEDHTDDPDPPENPEDPPTATPQTIAPTPCIKQLHNGHIIILREGKYYSLTGQQIHL